MAIGKNARKRAARSAFHNDPNAVGDIPYSFKVIQYRDGERHVLTFASMTSFKKYRETFFATNPTGQLTLASHEDASVNASRGQSFRSRVINQGADTSKAKPKPLAQFKGNRLVPSVIGKRFRSEGF